jgi:hypothetical protein
VRQQKLAEKDEFWCAVILTRNGCRLADQGRYRLYAAGVDPGTTPEMIGFPRIQ